MRPFFPVTRAKLHLILLTSRYPYAPGEEFVRAELPYLAEAFAGVTILPCLRIPNFDIDRPPPRELPEGVELAAPETSIIQRRWQEPAFRSGLHLLHGRLLVDLFADVFAFHEKRGSGQGALLGGAVTCAIVLRALRDLVQRLNVPVALYSYWLTGAAWAAGLVDAEVRVARAHGFDLYNTRPGAMQDARQARIIRRLNKVYAVSADGASHLQERHPALKNRIRVARLGVHAPQEGQQGSPDGVLRVVSCSSVSNIKRVPLVAAALRRCTRPTHWTHLGDGPEMDLVRAVCSEMPPHVTVSLPGAVRHEEVLRFFSQEKCDLFINLSESEGLPVSIMEALSAGVPVIATDVGGVRELVCEKTGALVSPLASPEEIAHEITAFADLENEAWPELRRRCLLQYEEFVSAERQYQIWTEEIYESAGR